MELMVADVFRLLESKKGIDLRTRINDF
jgi:hypothetical protein